MSTCKGSPSEPSPDDERQHDPLACEPGLSIQVPHARRIPAAKLPDDGEPSREHLFQQFRPRHFASLLFPVWTGAPRTGSGEGLTPPLIPGDSGGTLQRLAVEVISRFNTGVSAAEIIEQFMALPPEERAVVTKYVVEHDDSWIPEDFKQGMADAEAGRIVDMEIVMSGTPPPPREAK